VALDYIVVDDVADASRLVSALRRGLVGTETFLVLNSLSREKYDVSD
jgi:chromosome segregation ATPase